MATCRRRGEAWRIEVCRNGVRDSATFDTKAEAHKWAIRREAELSLTPEQKAANKTFGDAAQKYAESVSVGRKGERWERIRINAFQRTTTFWNTKLGEITPDVLGAWRDTRKKQVSDGSVRREYNLIRSIFEVARREWRWTPFNPCHDVRMPAMPRARTRRIAPHEVEIVLKQLGFVEGAIAESSYDEVAIAFLIALETAMRASEIINLRWHHVYLDAAYVHLADTKNGDSRDVPLSPRAVALFGLLPRKRERCFSISSATLSTLFRRARRESGLSGFTFHDSRREALSRLSRRLTVLQLARMAGHRNPKSLMTYYQESASEMAALLG